MVFFQRSNSNPTLTINLVLEDSKPLKIPYTDPLTVEELCRNVCRTLNIRPLSQYLFGLREEKKYFLPPHATIALKSATYEFRIRFKAPCIERLKEIDERTYNYYFQQVRYDILNKNIRIMFEQYTSELVGLAITDIFRTALEKELPVETVRKDYKKFFPNAYMWEQMLLVRRNVYDKLNKLQNTGASLEFIKSQYLQQVENITPEYPCEQYKVMYEVENQQVQSVILKVIPPTSNKAASIQYSFDLKNAKLILVCDIEDLGYIIIYDKLTISLDRLDSLPIRVTFKTEKLMWSFVTLVNGYYRLGCKWAFNLCKELETPSYKNLYRLKSHGPVGGQFSYTKLELKGHLARGCFILRESETDYDVSYIDVCTKNGSKPKTLKLDKTEEGYLFDNQTLYKNIKEFIDAHNNAEADIYLRECLAPSEYDDSPLLLCKIESNTDSLLNSSEVTHLSSSPALINYKDLQKYQGQRREGFGKRTVVFKGIWRVEKGKKVPVALKALTSQQQDFTEFVAMANQWAFVKSSSVVGLFGIAFSSGNMTMVTQYFEDGPLDVYLQRYKHILVNVHLLDASCCVAAALWHLVENHFVHGRIRCRKLIVVRHTEHSLTVKLRDPGADRTSVNTKEIHWLALELYATRQKKMSHATDIWAMATTIYEIFTYGESLLENDSARIARGYIDGRRMAKPNNCPDKIYQLMLNCWHAKPHERKEPQEIYRDLCQLTYAAKEAHSPMPQYSRIESPSRTSVGGDLDDVSEETDEFLTHNGDLPRSDAASSESGSISTATSGQRLLDFDIFDGDDNGLNGAMSEWPGFRADVVNTGAMNFDASISDVLELDDAFVHLGHVIGQGFYGEVHKGRLEYHNDPNREPCTVAVKKLKQGYSGKCWQDFQREIKIMKALQHENIVKILGAFNQNGLLLVMEYIKHGSLQSYLKINKDKWSVEQMLTFADNVARGMQYLAARKLVHRDLATRNILVVDEKRVKISDFGLAQFVNNGNYYILQSQSRELPVTWYAPEAFSMGKFSEKSDVWSFGVTLTEMFLHGEQPLPLTPNGCPSEQLQTMLLKAITEGKRYSCPPDCPSSIYTTLLMPCWQFDPHDRPTFTALIAEISHLQGRY